MKENEKLFFDLKNNLQKHKWTILYTSQHIIDRQIFHKWAVMIAIRFMSRFSVTDFYFASWNVIWVDAEVIPEKIKLIKINNWWFSAGLMQPMICHFLCLSKQASFSISKVFTDSFI